MISFETRIDSKGHDFVPIGRFCGRHGMTSIFHWHRTVLV